MGLTAGSEPLCPRFWDLGRSAVWVTSWVRHPRKQTWAFGH